MLENKFIIINGARQHNLKNVCLKIPKNKFIVFTGVSGSGKSSLAFDTIYAEGKRRYVESLSSYARQFLGIASKPDFDKIENLSPAISIDQKVVSHNPRSTVGTVTEIFDYFRLLFARVGTPFCPDCKIEIKSQTITMIMDQVLALPNNTQLLITAPVVTNKKGTHKNLFTLLKNDGFLRVLVNHKIRKLDEAIILDKNYKHNIDIVVDRLVLDLEDEDLKIRLRDAIEIATKYSKGLVKIKDENLDHELLFSQNFACKKCGFSIKELEPRLFSFNSPVGACLTCKGIGIKLEADIDLLIPDRTLSINEGAIVHYANFLHSDNIEWQNFYALLKHYDIDLDLPIESFTEFELNIILSGSDEPIEYDIISKSQRHWSRYEHIEGVAKLVERRYVETKSESSRRNYRRFLSDKKCYACHGNRLNPASLCVQILHKNIADACNLSISRLIDYVNKIKFADERKKISHHILSEIKTRLEFLNNVGLTYLTLARASGTLSGGESQRIRLATQIGSKLVGILYVLDEPSIGLHQSDNDRLIKTLKSMRDLGNTLIVVEHDEDTIRSADYIVDIGPHAGAHGGEIVYVGDLEGITLCKKSLTGKYLSGELSIALPKKRFQSADKYIAIYGASANNLKNIDIKLPLGIFTVITGVSGSGKSTLINDILYYAAKRHLHQSTVKIGTHKKIVGLKNIDKIVYVTQDPIGRTPRSNAATYTGVFDHIRDLFAATLEAKARGYLKGRFSFNVPGGRCEKCQGDGVLKIEMHFLPDIYIQCEECKGLRYNNETLQIKYKHYNISDVLNMTVEHALIFFTNQPKIKNILTTLNDVGLNYITLGQSAVEFSGGEAQRIKLATFLQKRPTGKSLYLLDEPTTGLHMYDVQKLINVVRRLAQNGDSVIMIEHNLDVIKVADYIIDLGPGAGEYGGKIIVQGQPEQIANHKTSLTGKYLKSYLLKK